MVEHTPGHPAIERLPHILARTGLGRSTLYALVANGAFPPPVRLTARAVGWRSDQVDSWLLSRVAARPREASSIQNNQV